MRRTEGHALVRVDYGAICKADIRYYLGCRDSKVLGLKYPLSLIHEAIGTVLKSGAGLEKGNKVVLVPNITFCNDECKSLICPSNGPGENYCPRASFASSNCDGFSKDIISFPAKNLVRLPEAEPDYVFCELISVALAALRRTSLNKASRVAVYGDGIMGYILCAVIREMYNCVIYAFGKHPGKLRMFKMCDKTFELDFPGANMPSFDTTFECVGGAASGLAIDSAIDLTSPGGEIILMGVSEESVPINTRKILEKGLTLKGTTRSCVADFETAVKLMLNTNLKKNIMQLVLGEIKINCIDDYYRAFETECANKQLGKYILEFNQ